MSVDKRTFFLVDWSVHMRATEFGRELIGKGWKVTFQPIGRTLDQNALQWPYLQAFSEQLQWPVNGSMVHMEPDDWKDVLTAAFQNETVRLAMGMSGGVVMLGLRTSKMSKARFSEWLDFLKATAALRGVTMHEDEKANPA